MRIEPDQVWNRPDRLGYSEGLRGLGGVVAPLLAGFSLAAIAQLSTTTTRPELADWSIAAFACAVALLLYAIQVSFAALTRDPSPATQLTWYPEALVDESAVVAARERQATTYEEMVIYWKRANIAYDWGVVAFLGGLVLLLVPQDWSTPRYVAIAVAGSALVLEIWWALSNRIERFPHPVFKSPQTPDIEPLGLHGRASVLDPDRREAAGLPRELEP